jgi:hypothetical protein
MSGEWGGMTRLWNISGDTLRPLAAGVGLYLMLRISLIRRFLYLMMRIIFQKFLTYAGSVVLCVQGWHAG